MRGVNRGWAVCLAVLLGLAGDAWAQQEAQGTDFFIVNNGPRTIEQVFVSPSGDRNWGRDRLGRRAIGPGDNQLMRGTLQDGCQGDVRVVFDGGGQMERRNQNLCRINKMFFNSPAAESRRPQSPDITIRNESDDQIESVYVTPAGDRDWGSDWLARNEAIRGKARRQIRIGRVLGCQLDIRATFQSGQHVEYYNENVCAESTVVFFAPQPDGSPGGGAQRPQVERRPPDTGDSPQVGPRVETPPSAGGRDPDNRSAERPGVGPIGGPGGVRPGGSGPGPGGGGMRPPANAGSGNVMVVNAYRVPLRELFISPAAARDWGRDLLPDKVLVQPNDRYSVRVETAQDCQFDIKAVWDSDAEQTIRNQNLCNGRPISLVGPRPGEKLWTGTGFYVSRTGHVLTNKHVIYGCATVVVAQANGVNVPLRVIAQDPDHDLALLQQANASVPSVTFRAGASPLRAGEPSISLGYPIRELLGSLIVTTGILSSLSGGRGDDAQFQMQTPIQPGNSGGPVFDESGLVIGVSTAQITRAGNRAVQNVNFGIKSEVARIFMETQGVKVETARPSAKLSPADIAEQQQKSVLPLTCYN